MVQTIPLSERPGEGWELCRRALKEVAAGRFPVEEWAVRTRQELDVGESTGVLAVEGSRLRGVALWSRIPLPARRVSLLYLLPEERSPSAYREFLHAMLDEFPKEGPVALSTGDIPGLDGATQAEMMEPLGFRRFARTEMEFPERLPLPRISLKPGTSSRPARPGDARELAVLHRMAYSGRFDRYLFMEDPEPGRDSERGMERLLRGEWGPFLSEDSFVAERAGRIVGAAMLVMMEGHPLLADVMVDPAVRGQGIAAALIVASLSSLRARSASPLRLNVTEGNGRAQRLYRSLGFAPVFTGIGWYARRWIPVPPEQE